MDISAKIRKLRTDKGLTLEQVGDYVGVSKATVLKWESGSIKNMRRDKIVKLSEILGTTPGDLVGWESQETSAIPNDYIQVSPQEKALIIAYRSNPSAQVFVNRILGLPDPEGGEK